MNGDDPRKPPVVAWFDADHRARTNDPEAVRQMIGFTGCEFSVP
jgi:hypothetical protein